MGVVEIILAVFFVALAIFVGWLVWEAFVWLANSGVFEVIGGLLAMIAWGGCLLLIGAFVLGLIAAIFQSIFGN